MNRRLRALLGRADRPAVDRHALPDAGHPRLAESAPFHRDEFRIGQPHRRLAADRRQDVADHEAPPNVG
jgi:hypothetical protein